MDFPTHFCVCAAYYFLCAAAEGTLLLTPGSYEDLVAASIVPVAVTIVIVYYRLSDRAGDFSGLKKIGLLLGPPQLKNPICAPGDWYMTNWSRCSFPDIILGTNVTLR